MALALVLALSVLALLTSLTSDLYFAELGCTKVQFPVSCTCAAILDFHSGTLQHIMTVLRRTLRPTIYAYY